jgi:hypothetical protein
VNAWLRSIVKLRSGSPGPDGPDKSGNSGSTAIDLKRFKRRPGRRTVELTRENRHRSIASVNTGHNQIVRVKSTWFFLVLGSDLIVQNVI